MATSGDSASRKPVSRIAAGVGSWRNFLGNPLTWRRASAREDASGAVADCGRVAVPDDIDAVIEADLLPRLMLAYSAGSAAQSIKDSAAVDEEFVHSFAELPLKLDASRLLEEVDRFIVAGLRVETVYVDVLAPAARRLGELWELDECDFVDVTMGLWRLQEVMRDIAARSPEITAPFAEPRSALFAPMPGDDHSFGAQMIEEVFARAGWASGVLVAPSRRELVDHVAHRPTDLVGLTVSRDCSISALGSLIKGMRSVSVNPHMRILIGGHVINQDPGIVAEVGADGTGVDAKAALELAERLILAAPVRAYTLT